MARLVSEPPLGSIPAGEGSIDISGAHSEGAALQVLRHPLGAGYLTDRIRAVLSHTAYRNPAIAEVLRSVPQVYLTLGKGTEIAGSWRFRFRVYLFRNELDEMSVR